MKIGIDISQVAYEGTGVGNYIRKLVTEILKNDKKNEYILFGSSLRKRHVFYKYFKNKKLVILPIPPTLLEIFWNRLHIFPVEWFTGKLDIFWSSDWTQPPLRQAQGVTTIHDLTILRYPENFNHGLRNIVETQKRRLKRAAKICTAFFCDSEATKKDAMELLKIPAYRLFVVYPGL